MHESVLFVEDNPDLRENAALVLTMEGYSVRVARDGREALDVLEEGFVPHLIVSDIMMPRMDGYEFFQAVRQRAHLRSVPFIFLTARGSRRDVSAGRMLGADDYLVKPFDPEEFLIAVQSKLQRAAELRAQANEDMAEARQTLVQMISHELRTPLTYVTGGFALLVEELERQTMNSTEDIRVSLDLIQDGTQRLSRLAEQTVLYAQLLSGHVAQRVKASADVLELAYLVDSALSVLGETARRRVVTVAQDTLDGSPIMVYGLPDMLVTAISEVVRNALQYSAAESTITIRLSRDNQDAVLTVIDQGIGIKANDLETIWNAMVQSERAQHEQQGVGMGLPIVKGIITAHKGTIALFSVPNQGTEVTLRLPLSKTA